MFINTILLLYKHKDKNKLQSENKESVRKKKKLFYKKQ